MSIDSKRLDEIERDGFRMDDYNRDLTELIRLARLGLNFDQLPMEWKNAVRLMELGQWAEQHGIQALMGAQRVFKLSKNIAMDWSENFEAQQVDSALAALPKEQE